MPTHGKIARCFFCIFICSGTVFYPASAQQDINGPIPDDMRRGRNMSEFFLKDETVGSIYLTRNWMKGRVELTNHKLLPSPENPLLFNFDKINNVLYAINKNNKVVFYTEDSVVSFNLVDNNMVFSFQKLSWVSDNFFLMPILKSDKGYSLYKRLFTKFLQADFSDEGYYTKGRKFDEYVDYYEYYLTYPGNTHFRKLYLKEKDIRRAFKDDNKLLDDFFGMHDREFSEQSLIGIVQFIDEKKYPE